MTLIILHYVFQSESCWVPETLLHTAVSKDIEILVSPQVAGGCPGWAGAGTGRGLGTEQSSPSQTPRSQPRLSPSHGRVIRAQLALVTEASLFGLVTSPPTAWVARRGCPSPALPTAAAAHRARPGLGADGCTSSSFSNVPPRHGR